MSPVKHVAAFEDGIGDVRRLIEIHEALGGDRQARRVLNKSAIVLLTACWEAYVEDLAENAFTFLMKRSKRHLDFPKRVRLLASKYLLEDLNKARIDLNRARMKIWDLAGPGWKTVLVLHKGRCIDKFHTPKREQIDDLFEKIIGLKQLSSAWKWRGFSARRAWDKLDTYVSLRGNIAHRVSFALCVTRGKVDDYLALTYRLAVRSTNRVRKYLRDITGKDPWAEYRYSKTI
jgi:hypothetical protein